MMNENTIARQIDDESELSKSEEKRFPERDSEAPKRSPIRRRHKTRNDDDFNPKDKRNHKKKHHRQRDEY